MFLFFSYVLIINIPIYLYIFIEKLPYHFHYWLYLILSPGGDLMPNTKYKMSETPINEYSLQMDLTITSLEPKDFGGYLCIAKNALGKAEGSIRLQGVLKSKTCTFHDITYLIVQQISNVFFNDIKSLIPNSNTHLNFDAFIGIFSFFVYLFNYILYYYSSLKVLTKI